MEAPGLYLRQRPFHSLRSLHAQEVDTSARARSLRAQLSRPSFVGTRARWFGGDAATGQVRKGCARGVGPPVAGCLIRCPSGREDVVQTERIVRLFQIFLPYTDVLSPAYFLGDLCRRVQKRSIRHSLRNIDIEP